jgi:hypothetical protein
VSILPTELNSLFIFLFFQWVKNISNAVFYMAYLHKENNTFQPFYQIMLSNKHQIQSDFIIVIDSQALKKK